MASQQKKELYFGLDCLTENIKAYHTAHDIEKKYLTCI